jgi:aminoglycoside phosphotransferase (APT) family kinase protein
VSAIDPALVRTLVDTAFPEWAGLPLTPVAEAGTDHHLFRLGDALCVRLPTADRIVGQADKEFRWLPELAPQLPLAVPNPVARGEPTADFPRAWGVYEWLEGRSAESARALGDRGAARILGTFVATLAGLDPEGGPLPGKHNFWRGCPLALRDEAVRDALATLDGIVDVDAAASVWEDALDAPLHDGRGRWVHGDLHPGNLLVCAGRLDAVIDFGGLAVGDPAVDLMPAWHWFSGEARAVFRTAVGAGDAAWRRGRGWALSMALLQLPAYGDDPARIARARASLDAVLEEAGARS